MSKLLLDINKLPKMKMINSDILFDYNSKQDMVIVSKKPDMDKTLATCMGLMRASNHPNRLDIKFEQPTLLQRIRKEIGVGFYVDHLENLLASFILLKYMGHLNSERVNYLKASFKWFKIEMKRKFKDYEVNNLNVLRKAKYYLPDEKVNDDRFNSIYNFCVSFFERGLIT